VTGVEALTERRFVLVDFRYANDAMGHVRLYEAGLTYDMRRALSCELSGASVKVLACPK